MLKRWRCAKIRLGTRLKLHVKLLVFLPWHTSNSGEGRSLLVVPHVLKKIFLADSDFPDQRAELLPGGADGGAIVRIIGDIAHFARVKFQVIKFKLIGVWKVNELVALRANAPMHGRARIVGIKNSGAPIDGILSSQ
mgnify:CR=1 FL=1